MTKLQTLNSEQQAMVEQNLSVIHWAIHSFIKVNESIFGFEYADLYGEGCLLLCKAALTYKTERGDFTPYAQTVVKNGLLSYARIMCQKQSRQRLLLDAALPDETGSYVELLPSEDTVDALIDALDSDSFFKRVKPRYSGVALLGIEALELKSHGYSSREIADLYGVKVKNVWSWISRATQKLRGDALALQALDRAG